MPYPKFLILVLEHLLLEWSAPSFIIGNLAQRFAFLLTFPDGTGVTVKNIANFGPLDFFTISSSQKTKKGRR
jgi:hypothetical protein